MENTVNECTARRPDPKFRAIFHKGENTIVLNFEVSRADSPKTMAFGALADEVRNFREWEFISCHMELV